MIQNSYAQKRNAERITNSTTSIFFDQTGYRGFKYQNINYFVDEDLQTVVAMKNGKITWKRNVVLECEKSKSSKSKIQGLKLHKGLLHAIYSGNDIWIELDGSIFICGG